MIKMKRTTMMMIMMMTKMKRKALFGEGLLGQHLMDGEGDDDALDWMPCLYQQRLHQVLFQRSRATACLALRLACRHRPQSSSDPIIALEISVRALAQMQSSKSACRFNKLFVLAVFIVLLFP